MPVGGRARRFGSGRGPWRQSGVGSAYRRLHILLPREGIRLNHKRLFRLYREGKLAIRRCGGRKRGLGTRLPMILPEAPNQRWSLDFTSETLDDGRWFRMLAVVDDFIRERMPMVVDTLLPGRRVGRKLDRISEHRGLPALIVSYNGTELTSHAIRAGRRSAVYWGTTSRRISRSRTGSWRASTGGSGTNA